MNLRQVNWPQNNIQASSLTVTSFKDITCDVIYNKLRYNSLLLNLKSYKCKTSGFILPN